VDLWGLKATDQRSPLDLFTDIMRSLVGTPYELGGKTLNGIDCSGTITYSLNQMGYNVSATSAAAMASGKTDWITVTSGNTISQDKPGALNFYDWGTGTVQHVNVGVGQRGNETCGQVVDATEGSWMTGRNGMPGQVIEAGAGQVNQTYTNYSSNSLPVSQGTINFDLLDEKYRNP